MVTTSCTPPTTLIPSALSQCYNVYSLRNQNKLPGLTLVLALVESLLVSRANPSPHLASLSNTTTNLLGAASPMSNPYQKWQVDCLNSST